MDFNFERKHILHYDVMQLDEEDQDEDTDWEDDEEDLDDQEEW